MPKLQFIDWIWSARGVIPLEPELSRSEVFARLDPLLEAAGTTHDAEGATITYVKDNPAAQDKLATFSCGTLQVVEDKGKPRLRYDLSSPALRLVFLAPLFFLLIAQGTTVLSDYERARQELEEQAEGEEGEKDDKEKEEAPRSVIDEFLGAPQPLTLEERKKIEEEKADDDKHSATPAYVIAGIFAFLWLVGRLLEPWLVRRTLRRALYPDLYPDETVFVTARRALATRFRRSSSST